MKRSILLTMISLALIFAFACDKKQESQSQEKAEQQPNATDKAMQQAQQAAAELPPVTLNKEIVDRYMATFPLMMEIIKQRNAEEGNPMRSIELTQDLAGKLKEKGWDTPEQFSAVHTKMARAMGYVSMQAMEIEKMPKNLQEHMQKQLDKMIEGFSEAELELVKSNQEELKKMVTQLASLRQEQMQQKMQQQNAQPADQPPPQPPAE